jgi:hypothetical protein
MANSANLVLMGLLSGKEEAKIEKGRMSSVRQLLFQHTVTGGHQDILCNSSSLSIIED